MRKRRNHDAGFKARLALEALKGERTVSELAGLLPVPWTRGDLSPKFPPVLRRVLGLMR